LHFLQDKSDKPSSRQDLSPVYGKDVHHPPGFNVGYLVSPYSYANGAAGALPVSMVSFAQFFSGDFLTGHINDSDDYGQASSVTQKQNFVCHLHQHTRALHEKNFRPTHTHKRQLKKCLEEILEKIFS
jgi:hypothetical protein